MIINEMSISTDFTQESDNSFSLLYDLSASNTKIKEKYLFTYSQEGIKLAYKEVIKFAREGISLNKIYLVHSTHKGNFLERANKKGKSKLPLG